MSVILSIVILILAFYILIKASDLFVDAMSSIAINFRMSKMMIALTVAAFGTCLPEFAISFNSLRAGATDIALSNVIGSNVINILLIIGVAAIVRPIKVKNSIIKKEIPLLLVITSIFVITLTANYINREAFILTKGDSILFILFFLLFVLYIVSVIKTKQGMVERSKAKFNIKQSILLIIVCFILILYASNIIVSKAQYFVRLLGVNDKIITMTVIVLGTSLPEMTMTVISAKKKEFDIAIGNIIGTNIFNIGIVLGVPLLIYGGVKTSYFNLIDILMLHLATSIFCYFAKNDKLISRKEGFIMITLFVLYYIYIFLQ